MDSVIFHLYCRFSALGLHRLVNETCGYVCSFFETLVLTYEFTQYHNPEEQRILDLLLSLGKKGERGV